jgi:hypothetical protein
MQWRLRVPNKQAKTISFRNSSLAEERPDWPPIRPTLARFAVDGTPDCPMADVSRFGHLNLHAMPRATPTGILPTAATTKAEQFRTSGGSCSAASRFF